MGQLLAHSRRRWRSLTGRPIRQHLVFLFPCGRRAEPADLHVLADEPPGLVPLQPPQGTQGAAPPQHKPALPSPPSPGSSSSSGLTTSRLGAAAGRWMGSALVRIGAVEGGEWARRRAPRPPPQQLQHRRRVGGFRPRPSRLSAVSMAGDHASENDQ
ncbi:unnamed protein product [Urochloa humidicola]